MDHRRGPGDLPHSAVAAQSQVMALTEAPITGRNNDGDRKVKRFMATPLINNFRMPFSNRSAAGELLALELQFYANQPDVLIFALPRGGVPVAAEISKALNLPMAVLVVRKLGVPGHEELAMGAVINGGTVYINRAVTDELGIPARLIDDVTRKETKEVARREFLYNRGVPLPEVKGKTVILVDDGAATGSSLLLAARALRNQQASKVVLAIPVAPAETVREFRKAADQIVCLIQPQPFYSVGQWYEDFHQLSDAEVCRILEDLPTQQPAIQISRARRRSRF